MKEYEVKRKILECLYADKNNFVSGEKISLALGCSRANIWKYFKKLIEDGYRFEAVTNKGYKLLETPDRLYGYDIAARLKTSVIGQEQIFYFESVGSTNDEAYSMAEAGEKEGALVVAETQTRGKGRRGRTWDSPRGLGLYFSMILRPKVELSALPSLTLVAAVSIAKLLREKYGILAGIKWPNDIYVSGRKIGGILTEMKAEPDAVDFVVMGIGLNVNGVRANLPDGATSLLVEKGQEVDRKELLRDMLAAFEANYIWYNAHGFGKYAGDVKGLSVLMGKSVKVAGFGKDFYGKAVDIDGTGALVIETPDGTRQVVYSGDVILCREE